MKAEEELEVARGLLERCYRDYVRMDALKNVIAFPPWPLTDDIANFLGKERIGGKGHSKDLENIFMDKEKGRTDHDSLL